MSIKETDKRDIKASLRHKLNLRCLQADKLENPGAIGKRSSRIPKSSEAWRERFGSHPIGMRKLKEGSR